MWQLYACHVVNLATQLALARYLSADVFLIVSSHIPLLVLLFQSVTTHLYQANAKHGKSFRAIPNFGQSAVYWGCLVELLIDIPLALFLLRFNPLLFYPCVVLVRFISARNSDCVVTRHVEAHRSDTFKGMCIFIEMLRSLFTFVTLVFPNHLVWSLWVCVAAYGIETFLRRRVAHHLFAQEFVGKYPPPAARSLSWTELWREWKLIIPRLYATLPAALFKRGHQYVTSAFVDASAMHHYMLMSNVRDALHILVLKPLKSQFTAHFARQDARQPLAWKVYLGSWVAFAVSFAILAPILTWPIVHLYGSGSSSSSEEQVSFYQQTDLLHIMVIMLVLFPFEVADRAIRAYAHSRHHKHPSVLLDALGSVIYLYLSIQSLQMLGLRGGIYVTLFPMLWRLVVRGPWL